MSGDSQACNKPEKSIEPRGKGENNDENMMKAEEVKTSWIRKSVSVLQEKCCAKSVEVPADVLDFVGLTKQSLELEHQQTKFEQVLPEVGRKLQIASSTELSAQNSSLAKA